MIIQSQRTGQYWNVIIIISAYAICAVIAVILTIFRIISTRRSLAAIPHQYTPGLADIPIEFYRNINAELERCRRIALKARPISRTPMVYISHPGLMPPSVANRGRLAETPYIDVIQLASEMLVTKAESIHSSFARPVGMPFKEYVDMLFNFSIIDISRVVIDDFIEQYEKARFSNNLITESQFSDLMETYRRIMVSMRFYHPQSDEESISITRNNNDQNTNMYYPESVKYSQSQYSLRSRRPSEVVPPSNNSTQLGKPSPDEYSNDELELKKVLTNISQATGLQFRDPFALDANGLHFSPNKPSTALQHTSLSRSSGSMGSKANLDTFMRSSNDPQEYKWDPKYENDNHSFVENMANLSRQISRGKASLKSIDSSKSFRSVKSHRSLKSLTSNLLKSVSYQNIPHPHLHGFRHKHSDGNDDESEPIKHHYSFYHHSSRRGSDSSIVIHPVANKPSGSPNQTYTSAPLLTPQINSENLALSLDEAPIGLQVSHTSGIDNLSLVRTPSRNTAPSVPNSLYNFHVAPQIASSSNHTPFLAPYYSVSDKSQNTGHNTPNDFYENRHLEPSDHRSITVAQLNTKPHVSLERELSSASDSFEILNSKQYQNLHFEHSQPHSNISISSRQRPSSSEHNSQYQSQRLKKPIIQSSFYPVKNKSSSRIHEDARSLHRSKSNSTTGRSDNESSNIPNIEVSGTKDSAEDNSDTSSVIRKPVGKTTDPPKEPKTRRFSGSYHQFLLNRKKPSTLLSPSSSVNKATKSDYDNTNTTDNAQQTLIPLIKIRSSSASTTTTDSSSSSVQKQQQQNIASPPSSALRPSNQRQTTPLSSSILAYSSQKMPTTSSNDNNSGKKSFITANFRNRATSSSIDTTRRGSENTRLRHSSSSSSADSITNLSDAGSVIIHHRH